MLIWFHNSDGSPPSIHTVRILHFRRHHDTVNHDRSQKLVICVVYALQNKSKCYCLSQSNKPGFGDIKEVIGYHDGT